VRSSTRRLTEAAQATLAPGERITSTGLGWAAARRDKVPLLFQARRQYWFALTDRRLLVFERHRGGPTAEDLVLGKRFDFFTLEAVKKVRPLLQVRVTGANGARQVLEFRPGQRALGSELVARVKGERAPAPSSAEPSASSASDAAPGSTEDDATASAFWGER
jgi:hypothetical protein